MNSVILLGNLTRDPETRFFDESSVCNFGIAVNERYTNRDGEVVEKPMFLDCEAWNRQGEIIAEFFVKGQQICVQGELQFDTWETDDGERRSKHKLRVSRFSFTGTKAENEKLRAEGGGGGGGGDDDEDEDGDADVPF